MPKLNDIAIFLLVNAIGFFSAHFCYVLGTTLGFIPVTDPELNPAAIKSFFQGIILTWMICAVFSLAAFFFKGKAKIFFLLMPAIAPMAYGLKVMLLF